MKATVSWCEGTRLRAKQNTTYMILAVRYLLVLGHDTVIGLLRREEEL